MSETKLEATQWGHSENFRYHSEKIRYDSEICSLRKFLKVCEIFAMCNSEIFIFYFLLTLLLAVFSFMGPYRISLP